MPSAAPEKSPEMKTGVQPTLLRARVSAFHAKPPFGPMEPGTPDDDSESAAGWR
ncbi:hypothetical protein [Arthrobacter sp. B6]|uniref:hypothetical protein n=1 Tax=Arthrobacter sp. B6 TaxID=1570137 RepID=UPI000AEAB018|nr:hypothetical protein [Arthrobacter sp. B6]